MNANCPVIPKNESRPDRIVRIVLGIGLLYAGVFYLTGTTQMVALILSVIALITGIVGFCGLYSMLGISSKKLKDN